jgi:gamma-glutamyltranspeptidase/glutathione hydrolase
MEQLAVPFSVRPCTRSMRVRQCIVLFAGLILAGNAEPSLAQRQLFEPEATTVRVEGALARANSYMITTSSRVASEAGRAIMAKGGSAVDAAIAAQLVLGLVEPQSSGLGGGAFLLHWNKETSSLVTYDGRETAPATAKPDRFLADGKPMPFDKAVHSGLSIGTPGLVRLLKAVHEKHGKLAWARLFEPAIRIAEDGFTVTPRLYLLLRITGPNAFDAAARRYFFDESGAPRSAGTVIKNPDYAATLKTIAEKGPDGFYSGRVAEQVLAAVAHAPNVAGDLSAADLAAYKVEVREPVCATYRTYKVCGMGPPSSGGIAIAQILTLLEPFDLGRVNDGRMPPEGVHLILEAQKLAYADRRRYLADPAFVSIPMGLTDPAYLADRRKLIDPAKSMPPPPPGMPPGVAKRAFGADATLETTGTSHLSVIDADGNAVAMTTTIEGVFGSGVMAAGFLLNNELTDFSFLPTDAEGQPIANRVEGGKRPRSTMSPTIVFDRNGDVFAVVGSPGGGRIIMFVTKALIALMDWELDAYQASALMNFGSMGEGADLETDWQSVLTGLRLKSYGHAVRIDLMNSGLNLLTVRDGIIEGGSDPRREGAALGE